MSNLWKQLREKIRAEGEPLTWDECRWIWWRAFRHDGAMKPRNLCPDCQGVGYLDQVLDDTGRRISQMEQPCPKCDTSGIIASRRPEYCDHCAGFGSLRDWREADEGQDYEDVECEHCRGTGLERGREEGDEMMPMAAPDQVIKQGGGATNDST